MLSEFRALEASWPEDMHRVLDVSLEASRRAELWEKICDDCDGLRKKFAWAIPDARALGVLEHCSPICEIGAGRGYWCSLVERSRGFDRLVPDFTYSQVSLGGPEKIVDGETLFLCYPDDDAQADEDEGEEDNMVVPLSQACLDSYEGDTVVLAGEFFVFGTSQPPFGKSFDSGFQVGLATNFHCVLAVDLPSCWPISKDSLSVWRRNRVCPIVFQAESDQDEDEEDHWPDVPKNETMTISLAAPCMRHLLAAPSST